MKLDQQVSSKNQNLIFARNGIGKSFLARALRSLDKSMLSTDDDSTIPDLLVSEESPNGCGNFRLQEGDVTIGSLELNTKQKTVNRTDPMFIFHVFSEDYVTEQIRNKLEDLDGKITHEIIVGKENVYLDQKINELSASNKKHEHHRATLDDLFAKARKKHKEDFSINAALGSFRNLQTEIYFRPSVFQPDGELPSLPEHLSQYNKFKALPSDPVLPIDLNVATLDIKEKEIASALATITSPSTIAEDLRQKISSDSEFIEKGLSLYYRNSSECPFCIQEISQTALATINAYIEYFDDREAKEIRGIDSLIRALQNARQTISTYQADYLVNKARFDDLKTYFPSYYDKQVSDSIPTFKEALEYLAARGKSPPGEVRG